MKKLIGTVAALLLVASAAFAELTIGGGATQLWAPVASPTVKDGDLVTGSYCPWGGGRTGSVSFNWISEDEKAGTSFAIVYDPWNATGGISPDGSRIIWVKPIDQIKLAIGHYDNFCGTDISNVATSSWNWLRPGTWVAGGSMFNEIEETGAFFEIKPIENLLIGVAMPFTENGYVYDMFEGFQAVVSYTIDGIGTIMASWNGPDSDGVNATKTGTDFDKKGEIDALFKLSAVENLSLAAGVRIVLWDGDEGKEKAGVMGGLTASYQINDALAVQADFGIEAGNDYDLGFHVGGGLTYVVMDKVTACADVRFCQPGAASNGPSADSHVSFLIGAEYACSTNGSIGIGFQGVTNGNNLADFKGVKDEFTWAVPIRVNVGF